MLGVSIKKSRLQTARPPAYRSKCLDLSNQPMNVKGRDKREDGTEANRDSRPAAPVPGLEGCTGGMLELVVTLGLEDSQTQARWDEGIATAVPRPWHGQAGAKLSL